MKPKRTIELVELRTLKVMVCFRGTTDAARALDLERKDVTAACESYAKTRPLTFSSYTLRYAQPGHFSAYIYGDQAEDYKKKRTETHHETALRFKSVFEEKQKAGTLGDTPECMYSGEKSPAENLDATGDVVTMAGMSELIEEAHVSEEKVDVSSIECGLDATALCLVCQTGPPHVVFEPCYHAALCISCAEVTCKSFCPICRTPITGRMQPKTAILVRPRIFSAYSFM